MRCEDLRYIYAGDVHISDYPQHIYGSLEWKSGFDSHSGVSDLLTLVIL